MTGGITAWNVETICLGGDKEMNKDLERLLELHIEYADSKDIFPPEEYTLLMLKINRMLNEAEK